jgi:hypothetical protein
MAGSAAGISGFIQNYHVWGKSEVYDTNQSISDRGRGRFVSVFNGCCSD